MNIKLFSAACLSGLLLAGPMNLTEQGTQWWSHVQFLASDKLQGREAGSTGHLEAARYVAAQFKRIGLEPAGTDGYLQEVQFSTRKYQEEKSSLVLINGGEKQTLRLGEDARFELRGQPEHAAQGEVVFIGYGLKIPEYQIDDFAGVDLKGKIAMHLSGAPTRVPGALAAHSQQAAERWKSLKAAGAIGEVSFENPKKSENTWEHTVSARFLPSMSLSRPGLEPLMGRRIGIAIHTANLDKWLVGTGHSAAEILKLDDEQKPLPHFPLKVRVEADIAFTESKAASQNVASVLRGKDPVLKSEYVVVSAHLDHLGVGPAIHGDSIYNGAMDNASGVASVIEIARALAAGPPLKRSMLFLTVTGEEKGLLGSNYFGNYPTVPIHQIVADINTDMFLPIVPLKSLVAYGEDESELGAVLKQVAAQHDVAMVPDPEPERRIFTRSDQYNFVRKGVPAISLKFGAPVGSPEAQTLNRWIKERYHQPSDDVNQPVDLEAAAKFNMVMQETAAAVANRPDRLHYYPKSFFKRFETVAE